MRHVALLPALAVLAGSLTALRFELNPAWVLGPALLIVPACTVAWRTGASRTVCALLAAGFFLSSAALTSDAKQRALHTPIRALLDAEFGGFDAASSIEVGRHDPIPTRFALVEDAAVTGDVVALRVTLQAVQLRERWHALAGEGARLTVAGEASDGLWHEWRAGRVLEAPVTFRRPARYLNDGVPDGERDLALAGTTLFGSIKSALLVDVRARGPALDEMAADVRAQVRAAIGRHVSIHDSVTGGIVTAVLIGDRTGMPDHVRERLQAAGTYHVIAISGGNIAILAGLALLALAVVGVRGRPAAIAALAVVLAYAHVVTAGPSVWRATLMAVTYLAARALDHRTPPWHAIATAAALMLVVRPLDIRDPGFLLSFGATAALIEGARRASAFVSSLGAHVATRTTGTLGVRRGTRRSGLLRVRRARRGARRSALLRAIRARRGTGRGLLLRVLRGTGYWLATSLLTSLAVEAVVMPVSAVGFSRVTAAGPVLNLVAVPMMTMVQVGGMVVSLVDGVEAIAVPAGYLAHGSARAIVESARLVEWWPWLSMRVPPPAVVFLVGHYAGLALALWSRHRGIGALLLGASTLAIVTGVGAYGPAPPADRLRVTVFDVGQSEAILLQVPGAAPLMVDSGGVVFGGGGADLGRRVLAPALWHRGVGRLGALLITHGDPDHVGGAAALVAAFLPTRLWTGVPVPSHRPDAELADAALARGVRLETRRRGEELAWGRARVRVLHPPMPDWERQRVRNDDSVVIEVLFGDAALLLAGDIGADVEREILPMLTPARIRILKVAHHGSRTSSSRELLEGWRPQVGVISAGRGNTFGHPAAEVLERLEAIGAAIYRTDLDGQITIDTDGRTLSVRTHSGGLQPRRPRHEAHEEHTSTSTTAGLRR
jgi:competence protein ComEC